MANQNTSGPAFPVPGLQHDPDFNGMTIRDYFAAKAMEQSVAAYFADDNAGNVDDRHAYKRGMAIEAYEWADAMLAAREAA